MNMKLLFRLIISFLLISTLGLILGLGFHQFRGLTEGVPAPVLIQQGTQLLETGNSESALETWQRAEQYYRAQNDLVGILGSQLNQAKALEELGFYPRSCQTILKSLGQENSNCGELKNEDITQILESIKLDYRNQISQEILLNQFFTKSNLLDPLDLYPFNIFHISTHGRFSSNLENTYLVAWKEYIKIRDLENILNTTQEIDDHHIKLLILTACETAKGDQRALLGLAGIAVKAGAQSTLGSLWLADKLSIPILVEEFYQELMDYPDLPITEALRKAQLKLIDQPASHPYQWAPYVLIGNWQ